MPTHYRDLIHWLSPVSLLLTLLASPAGWAEAPTRYLLIPKQENSEFFERAKAGCISAARTLADTECLYRGPALTDFRAQDQLLQQLLNEQLDGVAISVVRSDYLATNAVAAARTRGIPVVTFDADFDEQDLAAQPGLRRTFIGTDNFQLGFALGERLRQLRPNGGTLCILNGHPDSHNLQLRQQGLRASLKQSRHRLDLRLAESDWQEHPRCPLYNGDDMQVALAQLQHMLRESSQQDEGLALVTLGFWPQLHPDYADTVAPFRALLDRHHTLLLFADTLDRQLQHLANGLSHGNVGQMPDVMGYEAIMMLERINTRRAVPRRVVTPLRICYRSDAPGCQPQNDRQPP
ncbi:substrate-binding domain-containing protein [Motiliproteus sediminis]|uniref:substrate-binding domain-containing protein n=1 Tax=Motiliproteus sediminis TaxID=1468178 RepID=UPI001AF016D3|nr:substrate-binding domain-containing protein [Motiliproteus sediminis]